eukprot:1159697-Pelagomonas_calceolata.AAC.7
MPVEVCAWCLQVPPRTRITPEIDLSSHRPQQQAQKTQPVKYKRREPHVHMRAMMDKVSMPECEYVRGAQGAPCARAGHDGQGEHAMGVCYRHRALRVHMHTVINKVINKVIMPGDL